MQSDEVSDGAGPEISREEGTSLVASIFLVDWTSFIDRTSIVGGIPRGSLTVLGTGLFGLGLAVGSYGEFTRVLIERGIGPDLAGFGMTLFLLGQLAIVLPADRLTRTRPVHRVAAGGLGLGAIGAVAPAVDASLHWMLGSRLLLGIGQGIAFIGAMKYVGVRTSHARVSTAQGLLGALFTLGLALGIGLAPMLVEVGGVALPATIAGLVALAGGLGTSVQTPVKRGPVRAIQSYLEPLTEPVGLALGLGNMVTFGFLMVATTWYTAIYAGFPAFPVTRTLGLFAAMTVIGRALGGILVPRFGDKPVVGYGILGLAVSLGVFTLALVRTDPVLLGIATIGTALGFSVPFGPLFGLAFSELADDAGVTLAVMLVVGNAGALVYPWLVGVLLGGTGNYVAGFVAMTVSVFAVYVFWQVALGPGSMHK